MENHQHTLVVGNRKNSGEGDRSEDHEVTPLNGNPTANPNNGVFASLVPSGTINAKSHVLCDVTIDNKQHAPTASRSAMTVIAAMKKASAPGAPIGQRRVIFPSYAKHQKKFYSAGPYQYCGDLQSTSSFIQTQQTQNGVVQEPRNLNRLMPSLVPAKRSSAPPTLFKETAAEESTVSTVTSSTGTLESVTGSSTISICSSQSGDSQKQQQHSELAASPQRYRPFISLSPNRPSIGQVLASPIEAGNTSSQQSPLTLPTPIKSILRQVPRYAPPPTVSPLAKKPEESSVPSLVDIKEESDDDDVSQSSSDHDSGNDIPVASFEGPVITNGKSEPFCTGGAASQTQAPGTPCCNDSGLEAASGTAQSHRRISVDPRVWIREFHRSPEELACTWYTDEDMESFKRMALERILRYQSTTEIIATGTGRTIQRSIPRWSGPIYSHAALTLDGENDNDSYMKQIVLEKELRRVMIVDPHDMCLNLFAKTIKRALPRNTHVATATSSQEALKLLEQGKRFDMIIIEERLRLFHRQNAAANKGDAPRLQTPSGNRLMYSGAALIEVLSRSPLTSNSVFIGVSAHMKEDRAGLQRSGADFCWTKPPPTIDEKVVEELVKTILIKKGRATLASELYG